MRLHGKVNMFRLLHEHFTIRVLTRFLLPFLSSVTLVFITAFVLIIKLTLMVFLLISLFSCGTVALLLGLIQGIMMFCMNNAEFERRYVTTPSSIPF